ncbi:MAG: bifunctional phosphoribosyl-AMP cyclohydrolase/phosphoribosyl-ATP diphosphatase HisIE [Lachnospiraceae bacterium]|nr:bifunctional phosphoribosyl-AMP cyclohydrolase/phosphoribosyl-ATP diphosphatase HisIE [Lachnospiraceae bacterium]
MENKNIVGTIYIKNGRAVSSREDLENTYDILEVARLYNDSGVDKIFCVDLSDTEDEHEKNILAIRTINRNIDTKTCACGHINRIEDVKKLLYAGCVEVLLNASKPGVIDLLKEAAERFGKEKILVSLTNVDFLFKAKDIIEDTVHEFVIMNPSMCTSLESMSDIPYILVQNDYDLEQIASSLKSDKIRGIYGSFINSSDIDIMQLKCDLRERGITMDNFEPQLSWSDLKLNSDGMVPVIVQDYQTHEVLMLAYMNEEAFNTTIRIGKMTYWSRSRNELWTKGLTSGHIQYVKSLTADCDYDTILAKVSQVGAACHTGARSCFFHNIIEKEYTEKNPLRVLETMYQSINEHKEDPSGDSFTDEMFRRGLDFILQNVGKEATDIIISSKSVNKNNSRKEIADFLYDLMILMAQKELTWDDITRELSQR